MNNSEKIYLGIIGVLCYVLYFKASQKTACPSCKCEPAKPIYVPTFVPTNQPVVSPKILEEALIYTGPIKFRVPTPTPEDSSLEWIYFVKDNKYFKFKNWTTKSVPDEYIEVTLKEMIDAWNSVK
jgi:hypothetical protein